MAAVPRNRLPDRHRSASAGHTAVGIGNSGSSAVTGRGPSTSPAFSLPRPRTASGARHPGASAAKRPAAIATPYRAGARPAGSTPAWQPSAMQPQLNHPEHGLSRAHQAHAGGMMRTVAEADRAEALAAENLEVSAQVLQLDADLRAAQTRERQLESALRGAQDGATSAWAALEQLRGEVDRDLRPALAAQAARLAHAEAKATAAQEAAHQAENAAATDAAALAVSRDRRKQQAGRTAALEQQLSLQSRELQGLLAPQPRQHAQASAALDPQQQSVQFSDRAAVVKAASTRQHDASCQAAAEPAADGVHLEACSAWHSEDTGTEQSDEVALAAQQIAFHAGAASLVRQDAIRLQSQVDELQAVLAAERAAHSDARAALEALVRQQPPAAPFDATPQQAAPSQRQADASAGMPPGLLEQENSQRQERQHRDEQDWQQRSSQGDTQRAAEQAAHLRHTLQQTQDSNAALRADLHQTQHAKALLEASLEAEAAAAAATLAADAAELRALAERLRRSEDARIEAVQASLAHAGDAASAAELGRARAEIAVLSDRLARAQSEAALCRQQMRESEAGAFVESHAAREQQAADRLTAAQRDVGDLQARLSATANAMQQLPALHHFAATGSQEQQPTAQLRSQIAALMAQLAESRREAAEQQQRQQSASVDDTPEDAHMQGNSEGRLAADLAAKDRELAVMKEILLEQRSLNQRLQAQLGTSSDAAASHTVGDIHALRQQVIALQSQNADLRQQLQQLGAEPVTAGASTASGRRRLPALSAAGSTRRHTAATASAAGSATAADVISSLPHDAAELAALQQRVGYLEAQNSTLRAAAAGAKAAAAAALAPAPAPSDTAAAGGSVAEQQQLRAALEANGSAGGGCAAAAATGLPPQHARWDEQRKLQRQIDGLRSKLHEKGKAVEALSSDMQRLQAQLAAAQEESAAQTKGAEQLRGQLAEARAAAASHPLPPHEVQAVVERLATLDAEHTALQAKAELLRQHPAAAADAAVAVMGPASAADATAQAARRLPADAAPATLQAAAELLASRLRASAAEGRAQRLHGRLLAWFGAASAAADPDGGLHGPAIAAAGSRKGALSLRPGTPGGRDNVGGRGRMRPAFGAGAGVSVSLMNSSSTGKPNGAQQQVAQLQSLVAQLDTALAKAQQEAAGAVSTIKYMQAVQKAKQLQARVDVLAAQAADASQLRQQLAAAEGRETADRASLAVCEKRLAEELAAHTAASQHERLSQQLAASQQAAADHAAEADKQRQDAAAARKALQGLTTEVEASRQADSDLGGVSWKVEQDNVALRGELSALDPEFFEEIEDLKWERHQLRRRAAQYEGLIANLATELGRAPPAALATTVGPLAPEQLLAAAAGGQQGSGVAAGVAASGAEFAALAGGFGCDENVFPGRTFDFVH